MTHTEPPSLRQVAVVLNGSAGALLERPGAERELIELFQQAGFDPHFVPKDAGSLPERMARACDMGAEAVVVAGGDGTVTCAAQALADTGVALGILPFGTMNLLAKDLGLPVGDVAAAVQALAHGSPRNIDIAEVNGHVFLIASMLGLPATIGRHREAQRGRGLLPVRWVRLARAGVRSYLHHGPPNLRLELNGRTRRMRPASITVTVNALADGSDAMFSRPNLDGGELAVVVVRRLTVANMLRLALGFMRGTWRHGGVAQEHRTTALTIRARRRALRVMNDGEGMVLAPPLAYRLRPRALRVIVP